MLNRLAIASFVSFLGFSSVNAATSRTWNSANGKFSVEASIKELGEDSVTLEKEGGKSLEVEIEKLSENDKEFIDRMRRTQFEIDGIGSISAPSDQYQWNLASKQKTKGGQLSVYSCMIPGSTEALIVTISPQIATFDAQRIAHLKGNFNGLVNGFDKAGFKFVDPKLPEFKSPVPDAFRYSIALERPDGSPIEVRILYLFRDSHSIFFQSLGNTAETADKQLAVAETFIED